MTSSAFPKGFENLEHYAEAWVIPDVIERQQKRADSDFQTLREFYEGLAPEIDRVIGYLKTVPMDQMSASDENLYALVSTWNEMSHPLDLNWPETDQAWTYAFERIDIQERLPGGE